MVGPSIVEVEGTGGRSLGFFVAVSRPNPNSRYVATTYSAVQTGCRVAVRLANEPVSVPPAWSYVHAIDPDINLAILELPGSFPNPLHLIGQNGADVPGDEFTVGLDANRRPVVVPLDRTKPDAFQAFRGGPVVNAAGEVAGMVIPGFRPAGAVTEQPGTVPLSQEIIDRTIARYRSQPASMRTTPEEPIAGREVVFELQARPNQIVEISHFSPDGEKVDWTFPNGGTGADGGEPITSKKLGVDPCGRVSWKRPGTLDVEGEWAVEVTFDPHSEKPETTEFRYSMHQLELEGQGSLNLWAELTSIEGEESTVYYSGSVPTALALDLQSRTVQIANLMQDRLGLVGSGVPDLYLLGNRTEYDQVKRLLGSEPGWEAGFHRPPCPQCSRDRPGVYIRLYVLDSRSSLHNLLTHEYFHALINQATDGRGEVLTAWINEGLAEWSSHEFLLAGDDTSGRNSSRATQMEEVRTAAASGTLFRLAALESRHSWGNQAANKVDLQYAQSYMAMRYLIETYGATTASDLAVDRARGSSWSLAMGEALGIGYTRFESDFAAWLKAKGPSEPYYDRGIQHFDKGEYEDAITQFSAAIDLDPHRYWYFTSLGWAYYYLGQSEPALENANHAARMLSGDPWNHNLRARALSGLRRYQDAIAAFTLAIQLDPHQLHYRGRGIAHFRLAEYHRALIDLDRAVLIDSDFASAYDWRAATHGKLGNDAQQQSDQRMACSLDNTLLFC